MSENDIPEWARNRAAQLSMNEPSWPLEVVMTAKDFGPGGVGVAFARYIATHEEAPVDPLLVEARALACDFSQLVAKDVLNGNYDGSDYVRLAANALRRGIELAKSGEA